MAKGCAKPARAKPHGVFVASRLLADEALGGSREGGAAVHPTREAMMAVLAALRRRATRPRLRRGRVPSLCPDLLIALVPFALLAASPFTDLTGVHYAGVTKGCVPDANTARPRA